MSKPSSASKTSNFINALLYSTESITALFFSVVTTSLIARHFGPESLARFSLAQSVSTIFLVFSTLGFEQFIIKHVARHDKDDAFVTTIIIGMLGGWLVYTLFVFGYYYFFNDIRDEFYLILVVISTTLLLRVIFIKTYLQARHMPKPIALASFMSRVISLAYLIIGSYWHFSFDAMMLYMPLQALLLNFIMLVKEPSFIARLRLSAFDFQILKRTFKEASPLLLATFLYFFYSQTDILIMTNFLDAEEVGVYSAAQRLVPQAAFIAFVMVTTFYKELDARLLNDRNSFNELVTTLLTVQFGIGIVLSCIVFLAAEIIVSLLYGSQYDDSIVILQTVCWAWVFIMPAALYSRLLIMLGLVKYELIKMLILAPIVIALYYIVTPQFGNKGVAFIYVGGYCLVDFLIYFMFKDTRPLALMGLAALFNIITKPIQTMQTIVKVFKNKSA